MSFSTDSTGNRFNKAENETSLRALRQNMSMPLFTPHKLQDLATPEFIEAVNMILRREAHFTGTRPHLRVII